MKLKIACVQMSPVYLNTDETVKKICRYVEKASNNRVDLVVFPELILSGYPNFNTMSAPEYRKTYNHAAIQAEGPEMRQVAQTTDGKNIAVVLGFIERDPDFPEVLYDSSSVIDSGTIVGTHRKIAPFGGEKVIFKQGDARDLRIYETGKGKLGIGLCFENLNPLYRRALALLGEEIHCSLWVTSEGFKHVVDSSSRVTAVEAGIHVALASQVTGKEAGPLERGMTFVGGSGILHPWGKYLAGPDYGDEKLLFAETDTDLWDTQKFQSRGIESRNDLLSLNIAMNSYEPFYRKDQRRVNVSEEEKGQGVGNEMSKTC